MNENEHVSNIVLTSLVCF